MKFPWKILADNIQHDAVLKQLVVTCIGDDYHIHVRINNYVLPQHSVKFKAAGAGLHPYLVTVSVSALDALLMLGCGNFHPEFRNDLLAVPFAFLQIKLSKFSHVFRTKEKSPSSLGNALRTGFPEITGNAKGSEKPRLQILCKCLTSALCDNCGKNIGVQTVV